MSKKKLALRGTNASFTFFVRSLLASACAVLANASPPEIDDEELNIHTTSTYKKTRMGKMTTLA